ncbi:tRNA (mnm(5)s(2)U34)-methyltransferase [Ferviditalea candida]|uniref:Class I SAM-dependent methyltransferase n=1 Tax=Ferviditalea candida TaxID=3108399 RepID=A0ABU5ZEU2_9BACL|nr:class I SAM-dependent methyltransferase [Paenibacillaceae bacterium T2]
MGFLSILSFAHHLVKERTASGDAVIDATMGNGNDMLFLTEQVGSEGTVYGFDIQPQALEQTRAKLEQAGVYREERIHLYLQNHEFMLDTLPHGLFGRIAAVMFNLGYLPGHNHGIITRPESTLPALQAALQLLKNGGILTIVLYSGHEGGKRETEAVLDWAARLSQASYQVLRYGFLNQKNDPPFLIAIEKR